MFAALERRHGAMLARRKARHLVMFCWAVLLLLTLCSSLMIHFNSATSPLSVVMRILPLVLIAAAFTGYRPRGYYWLAFIGLLYGAQGFMLVQLPDLWWLGLLEGMAGLALLTTALGLARHIRRWQQASR